MFNIPIIKSNSCFPGAHCQSTLGPWDGRQYDKDDEDDDHLGDDDDLLNDDGDHLDDDDDHLDEDNDHPGDDDGRLYDNDDKDDDRLDDYDGNEYNDDDHQHEYINDDSDNDDHYVYECRRCKRLLEILTAQQSRVGSRQNLNRGGFVNIMTQTDWSQAKKEKISTVKNGRFHKKM